MSWPTDPNGSMVPILEASIAAHPSSLPPVTPSGAVVLTAADRCDSDCPAAAVYRVSKALDTAFYGPAAKQVDRPTLDFCLHHWRKNFPPMVSQGWAVIGGNPDLLAANAQEAIHGAPQ